MKYAIINGYRDKHESDGTLGDIVFENCIGIVDSVEEAYGIAYLTLCNAIRDSDQEGEVITIRPPIYDEDNKDCYNSLVQWWENEKKTIRILNSECSDCKWSNQAEHMWPCNHCSHNCPYHWTTKD